MKKLIGIVFSTLLSVGCFAQNTITIEEDATENRLVIASGNSEYTIWGDGFVPTYEELYRSDDKLVISAYGGGNCGREAYVFKLSNSELIKERLKGCGSWDKYSDGVIKSNASSYLHTYCGYQAPRAHWVFLPSFFDFTSADTLYTERSPIVFVQDESIKEELKNAFSRVEKYKLIDKISDAKELAFCQQDLNSIGLEVSYDTLISIYR